MNANPEFLNSAASIDEATVAPLPKSTKVYVDGTNQGVRVPMREISQADTAATFGLEKNPPIFVYDTSGPYTDPDADIDIRKGLPPLRGPWIEQRSDTVSYQHKLNQRKPECLLFALAWWFLVSPFEAVERPHLWWTWWV